MPLNVTTPAPPGKTFLLINVLAHLSLMVYCVILLLKLQQSQPIWFLNTLNRKSQMMAWRKGRVYDRWWQAIAGLRTIGLEDWCCNRMKTFSVNQMLLFPRDCFFAAQSPNLGPEWATPLMDSCLVFVRAVFLLWRFCMRMACSSLTSIPKTSIRFYISITSVLYRDHRNLIVALKDGQNPN